MIHGVDQAIASLHSLATPEKKAQVLKFFKTGPGSYGEGDLFLGVYVPQLRQLVKKMTHFTLSEWEELLRSPFHEARLLALFGLNEAFKKGRQDEIYALYERQIHFVNNWDLVDQSAPYIPGPFLEISGRDKLFDWIEAPSLWLRRIAIVATLAYIRKDDFKTTLALAEKLLEDREDLLQKASGWMLREVGKRDSALLEQFLKKHVSQMPRTTLRYAIERFDPETRRKYLLAIA